MFRLLRRLFHRGHCCGLIAIAAALCATSAHACGVALQIAVPAAVVYSAPAVVSAPAIVSAPACSNALAAAPLGVTIQTTTYATPVVALAPLTTVLPSYTYFAAPAVALAAPYASVELAVVREHVGFFDRRAEHRAVRLNARAQHAAIRAQR